MDGDGNDSELSRLERARLLALVERDIDVAGSLHADDYELITPAGQVLSKSAYLDAVADGTLRYRRFEPAERIRSRVTADSAIVRYRARIDVVWDGGGDVDEFWHTDYWERRDDRWEVVWSQATRIARRDGE